MVGVRREAIAAARTGVLAGLMALAAAPAGVAQEQPRVADDVLQGLSVIPVTFQLLPGQMTAVLTVENHTDRETDFQVRPFAWAQTGGDDQLTPTSLLVVSPPLGRVAVGAGQVVRLVLRQPAQAREASYRILLDQVPPPREPGVIGFALRLSMPVFVEPAARVRPQVTWSLQADGGAWYLVAVNSGGRHDVFSGLALRTADGRPLALESNISPYVLAGGARRWRIITPGFAPSGAPLRLTAQADSGAIDETVPATAGP